MSEINDGGPAFPTVVPAPGFQHIEFGMTLRDWFAGQAMAGFCTNHPDFTDFEKWNADEHAKQAYRFADAMLKAREVEP